MGKGDPKRANVSRTEARLSPGEKTNLPETRGFKRGKNENGRDKETKKKTTNSRLGSKAVGEKRIIAFGLANG